MKYLLDTNVCIYIIKAKPPAVLARFEYLKPSQVFISAVTVFELSYGVENSSARKRNLAALESFLRPLSIVDFTAQDARYAARIRAELKRKGTPIGPYDLQIAATALSNHFTLVTNNTAEFARVTGLKLENWA